MADTISNQVIKKTVVPGGVRLTLYLRNRALTLFYLGVLGLFLILAHYFKRLFYKVLSPDGALFIGLIIVLYTIYLILKSMFGQARVTMRDGYLRTFEGLFPLGRRNKLPIASIDEVFIARKETPSRYHEGLPRPGQIKQFVHIKGGHEIRLLYNQVATPHLQAFCKAIDEELSSFKS